MQKTFLPVKNRNSKILSAVRKYVLSYIAFFVICFSSFSVRVQRSSHRVVKVNEVKASVEPTMWGAFFEDINMGADGGIYAELVKNRSFEYLKQMLGWAVLGKPQTEDDFQVMNRQQAATANPRFLHVTLHNNKKRTIGLSNEGFRGMGIKNDLGYDFSVMYRQPAAGLKLHWELVDEQGKNIGGTTVSTTAAKEEI